MVDSKKKVTLGDVLGHMHAIKRDLELNKMLDNLGREEMKSIGAMWIRKDKNGDNYFTMALKQESFVIFKNKNKKENNHPDFYVFLRGPEKNAAKEDDTPVEKSEEKPN